MIPPGSRSDSPPSGPRRRRRVFLLGATGTIGRATLSALLRRGHEVVCFVRPPPGGGGGSPVSDGEWPPAGAVLRFGDVTDPSSLLREGFCGERFDALVSCLASRTGAPEDAWRIDYQAHQHALTAACDAGGTHLVLLSAICVQKPMLEFQRAKLACEQAWIASGLPYTIVRPTAFFKSLSGQVERVRRGKPFLLIADGTLTRCKPISDHDLAEYLCECLDDDNRKNCVLPIGGPGAAITPREQGEHLFRLLGRPPRFRQVPIALLDAIVGGLATAGRVVPALAHKADFAKIGRYYATESMLVRDPVTGRYDAERTPSTGSQTLFDFYARLIGGAPAPSRGDHAFF